MKTQFQNISFKFTWFCYIFTNFAKKKKKKKKKKKEKEKKNRVIFYTHNKGIYQI